MKPFFRRSLRTFATVLAAIYFAQNVLFLHAAETNIWAIRRENLKNAVQLPKQERSLAQFLPASDAAPAASRLPISVRRAIAPSANIVDVAFAASPAAKTIYLIQDAHLHQEAQRNIAATLMALSRVQPERAANLLVGLEGADAERIDFSKFNLYPHRQMMRAVAQGMLKANLINGVELAAIGFGAEQEGPVSLPFSVTGVEKQADYDADVKAIRDAVPLKATAERNLSQWERTLAALKRANGTPGFNRFLANVVAYEEGKLSVPDYACALSAIAPASTPNTRLLLEAVRLEQGLDFQRIEAERKKLVAAATVDGREFNPARYPWVARYLRYVRLSERINAAALIQEIAAWEKECGGKVARTAAQRDILAQQKQFFLTKKLVNHTLTADEWKEYASPRRAPRLEPFEDFYRLALQRNDNMADRFARRLMKADTNIGVLVAGGFHTEGLRALLKEKGFNVFTLSPKITKLDESAPSSIDILASNRLPLDQLFVGERLFIPLPANSVNPLFGNVAVAASEALRTKETATDGPAVAKPASESGDGVIETESGNVKLSLQSRREGKIDVRMRIALWGGFGICIAAAFALNLNLMWTGLAILGIGVVIGLIKYPIKWNPKREPKMAQRVGFVHPSAWGPTPDSIPANLKPLFEAYRQHAIDHVKLALDNASSATILNNVKAHFEMVTEAQVSSLYRYEAFRNRHKEILSWMDGLIELAALSGSSPHYHRLPSVNILLIGTLLPALMGAGPANGNGNGIPEAVIIGGIVAVIIFSIAAWVFTRQERFHQHESELLPPAISPKFEPLPQPITFINGALIPLAENILLVAMASALFNFVAGAGFAPFWTALICVTFFSALIMSLSLERTNEKMLIKRLIVHRLLTLPLSVGFVLLLHQGDIVAFLIGATFSACIATAYNSALTARHPNDLIDKMKSSGPAIFIVVALVPMLAGAGWADGRSGSIVFLLFWVVAIAIVGEMMSAAPFKGWRTYQNTIRQARTWGDVIPVPLYSMLSGYLIQHATVLFKRQSGDSDDLTALLKRFAAKTRDENQRKIVRLAIENLAELKKPEIPSGIYAATLHRILDLLIRIPSFREELMDMATIRNGNGGPADSSYFDNDPIEALLWSMSRTEKAVALAALDAKVEFEKKITTEIRQARIALRNLLEDGFIANAVKRLRPHFEAHDVFSAIERAFSKVVEVEPGQDDINKYLRVRATLKIFFLDQDERVTDHLAFLLRRRGGPDENGIETYVGGKTFHRILSEAFDIRRRADLIGVSLSHHDAETLVKARLRAKEVGRAWGVPHGASVVEGVGPEHADDRYDLFKHQKGKSPYELLASAPLSVETMLGAIAELLGSDETLLFKEMSVKTPDGSHIVALRPQQVRAREMSALANLLEVRPILKELVPNPNARVVLHHVAGTEIELFDADFKVKGLAGVRSLHVFEPSEDPTAVIADHKKRVWQRKTSTYGDAELGKADTLIAFYQEHSMADFIDETERQTRGGKACSIGWLGSEHDFDSKLSAYERFVRSQSNSAGLVAGISELRMKLATGKVKLLAVKDLGAYPTVLPSGELDITKAMLDLKAQFELANGLKGPSRIVAVSDSKTLECSAISGILDLVTYRYNFVLLQELEGQLNAIILATQQA